MGSRVRTITTAVLLVAASGCGDSGGGEQRVLLVAPAQTDARGESLTEEVAQYLETLAGEPRVERRDADDFGAIERLARDEAAPVVIVLEAEQVAPDRIEPGRVEALDRSDFILETIAEDDDRTFLLTAGATTLARQYAAYEVLRRLGARFYHPEQEYVPTLPAEDLAAIARRPTALHVDDEVYRPDYRWRSWSFHGSHPLEHLEAFSDAAHPIDEAENVSLWIAKNKGNRFKGLGRGVSSEDSRAQRRAELEELRDTLGFPRGAGITLHNEQQGATAEIDRDSPVPVRQQIEELVDAKLADAPDAAWFSIHFGPTEFTVTPDDETVEWIDGAGQRALQSRPEVEVEINVHITGSQATPNFADLSCPNGTNDDGRGDYYDLAFHTDGRLGANVHTVMFYPLEGSALVYNQRTFAHKQCLMEQASAAGRPLTWFPEGSWWLSFDNPIPVYLPLYIWTRGRDIELLRPLLPRNGGTLGGHRMFNSGQEWGYWQQDYAVGLWAWNADASLEEVLGEMFDPLCDASDWKDGCAARTEAIAVMTESIDHQRDVFLEREDYKGDAGGLYPYFAGEDQADIIAAASGFEFRPVRVGFGEVAGWDDTERDHFTATDLAALQEASAFYDDALARLQSVRGDVPEAGLPWLDEVLDGIEINAARAEHTHALYSAVVEMERGEEHFARADAALARAIDVIARREAAYRYPAAQTHGGGLTPETGVANGTTYPFRVHTKTHLMTYWHNRHAEVRTLLDGGSLGDSTAVVIENALAAPGEPVMVTWPDLDDLSGEATIEGVETIGAGVDTQVDLGPGPGYWPVSGELITEGRAVDIVGGVARAPILGMTPAGDVTLTEPADPLAQSVLASVFPALRYGRLADVPALAFGPDPDEDGSVAFDALAFASTTDGDAFASDPVSFELPVALSSGGAAISIELIAVVVSGTVAGDTLDSPVAMEGSISIPDLVVALQELAGFDEAGALQTLSGILGFDPADPPVSVPFAAELAIAEAP